MALRIHVARQTIGKWENGVSYPSLEMLNVLSRELGTSANELLGQEKINDIVLAEAGERKKRQKENMARDRGQSRFFGRG